jgi:hypothetical protein
MSCDRLPVIRMRVRVARAAINADQCALARAWLQRLGHDLRTIKPQAVMSPCGRVIARPRGML